MESFRILFIGEIEPFQTTFVRRDAFLELGFPLEVVDRNEFLKNLPPTLRRLSFYSLRTPPVFAFNREILDRARRFRPELIWIEKGVYVFPETLRALRRDPSPLLVHHNTDDSRGLSPALRLHWRYLLRAMRLYDVHITSNLHNVRELRDAGFPRSPPRGSALSRPCPQIGTALFGDFLGLLAPPFGDFLMVAGQQHLGDGAALP